MKQFLLKTSLIFLVFFTSKTISAQSFNANFGYSVNCRTITLTDSSTGPNLAFYWEFGDGNTDYTRNTSYTYSINGSYKVSLIITCWDSLSSNFLKRDTLSRQINISCSTCNIKAEFSTARDPLVSKKLIFTNKTVGQTTYTSLWDFGDASGSSATDPAHTFPASGYYFVTLKTSYYDIGLSQTCTDSIVKKILVNKLKANFGYRIDTVNCTTVTFLDSCEGFPSHQYWEFGDNGSAYSAQPTYTYSIGNGTSTQYFNVRLRIYFYDSSNSTYYGDTIIKTIVLPPCNICQINANIYMGGDSTIPWQGVLYNYSSGMINKHYWNFGDGGTSTSASPVHTYAGPGVYTITYIAMDTIKNCTDTARVTFYIDSAGYLKRKAFTLTVIDRTTTGLTQKETAEKPGLKVYPNPTAGIINIDFNSNISYTEMKLINGMGQILYSGPVTPTLDMGHFPKGVYILITTSEVGTFSTHIIRE